MSRSGEPTVEGVNLQGMREYLAQTEIEFGIIFGSRARGTANKSSDVDVALRFPGDMDESERFHQRNRIDAELQAYADGFVDVSDIETLPIHVAYAALRDGIRIVGDESSVEAYKENVERKYMAESSEREQNRREFIERLAQGDV